MVSFDAPEQDASDWGPLAVNLATGGDDALTHGVLRIEDDCVTLGGNTLLVWSAEDTEWIASDATIRVTTSSGETVSLADGDRVALGGGGRELEPGQASRFGFQVNTPDDSCLGRVTALWGISEVVAVELDAATAAAAGVDVVAGGGCGPGMFYAYSGDRNAVVLVDISTLLEASDIAVGGNSVTLAIGDDRVAAQLLLGLAADQEVCTDAGSGVDRLERLEVVEGTLEVRVYAHPRTGRLRGDLVATGLKALPADGEPGQVMISDFTVNRARLDSQQG